MSAHHFVPWYEYQRSQSLVYHKALSNECFAEAARRAEQLGIKVFLEAPFEIEPMAPKRHAIETRGKPQRDDCFLPWTSISVNEWGIVHPCCGSDMFMGDLNRQQFGEVWNGHRYQELRETVNSDEPLSVCATCVQRMLFSSSTEKEVNLLRNVRRADGAGVGELETRIKELECLVQQYERGRFIRTMAALEKFKEKVGGWLRG